MPNKKATRFLTTIPWLINIGARLVKEIMIMVNLFVVFVQR